MQARASQEKAVRPSVHPSVTLSVVRLSNAWIVTKRKQVAQLSQRDRAAGWVSYGQSGRVELGDEYLRTL